LLTQPPPAQLVAGTVALSKRALALIDLTTHAATHPRLGALDHISVHPLGRWRPVLLPPQQQQPSQEQPSQQSLHEPLPEWEPAEGQQGNGGSGMEAACFAARAIGRALATLPPSGLPVFYYGSAHPEGRRLAEIRRGLGGWAAWARAWVGWLRALGCGACGAVKYGCAL